MAPFKVERVYLVFLAILSILAAIRLAVFIYEASFNFQNRNMAIFLFSSIFAIAFISFIYALFLRIETDGVCIKLKTLLGIKQMKFSDIIDCYVLDMKSRFIVMLISNEGNFGGFIKFSSIISDFPKLAEIARENLSESLREPFSKISFQKHEAKGKLLKAVFVIISVVLAAPLVFNF